MFVLYFNLSILSPVMKPFGIKAPIHQSPYQTPIFDIIYSHDPPVNSPKLQFMEQQ